MMMERPPGKKDSRKRAALLEQGIEMRYNPHHPQQPIEAAAAAAAAAAAGAAAAVAAAGIQGPLQNL